MPNISIVIPAYNAGNFIAKCIESCLAQSYKDFEIIVVDDGSIDNTSVIVKSFCEHLPSVVKYFYKNNEGVSSARNFGIINARGRYVAFLDSDDVYLPDKLENSIDFMVKNDFDWICTAFTKIYNDISEERRIVYSGFLDEGTNEIRLLDNGVFFFSNLAIQTSTVILKKSCFDTVGLFDSNFKAGEDWDMWFRLERCGYRCGYLDKYLTSAIHNQQSITKKGDVDCLYYHLILAEKYSRLLGFNNKNSNALFCTLMEIARNYYYKKKYSKMVSVLLRCCYYKINFLISRNG